MKNVVKHHFVIILFFLSFIDVRAFSQPSIDEIISKHLENTGFANFPSDLKAFKIEGEMIQNKLHFPLKIHGIVPDRLRMDIIYNEQNYIKISNGDISWDYNPMVDSVSSGMNQKKDAQNFIDRLTGGLYKYKSGLVTGRLLGLVSIDDVELYKVEILEDKHVQIYYIDRLSFLIIRIDDDVVENKITYYNDYRKIGNYYFPFSLSGFESGVQSIAMKFKSIIINPQIPMELFDKPERIKFK